MERVLIIGNCGSGKSTFAKALAKATGLPLVHLDRLHWVGNWEARPREEFDALLQQELEKPRWIIDGNFSRTMEHRLRYCDTVFFLDLPPLVCLWGVIRRMITDYGRTREDMGGNCPEKLDKAKLEFFKSTLQYNRRSRSKYYGYLEAQKGIRVIIFKNRRQIKQYLKKITQPSL